ncbi:MAG TPA: hypothetical protein VD908_02655 [Cytophagales bacterium]|nr:hypothetical protein [Cytophagales bacterium]
MNYIISSNQERLSELLKRKGIGPEGSKSLKAEQIEELKCLLIQKDVSLTTKATFLTALYTLPPTEVEREFIKALNLEPEKYLQKELIEFFSKSTSNPFLKIIQKVISNHDLDEEEAKQAMVLFFDPAQPDYLKASFLEAERLKRETFTENRTFFESLWNEVEHTDINTSVLIDIEDSYDGCNRTKHFSVFVAALLASAGYPTYLTGMDSVAPKEAVTSHQILKKAGKNPLKSKTSVISDILNPEIRWGYIDQQVFFPKLYALKAMRKEMVKRPFLATFEKLLQPIRASGGNCIITGYTHAHYKDELVKQLQNQNKCAQALVLKGVEGSTQVSMSRNTIGVHFNGKEIFEYAINSEEYGFETFNVARDVSITPEVSLMEGIEALEGKDGFAKENILYTASIILDKLGLVESKATKAYLNSFIESGSALRHWKNGCL